MLSVASALYAQLVFEVNGCESACQLRYGGFSRQGLFV